jgi:hypothetical protein
MFTNSSSPNLDNFLPSPLFLTPTNGTLVNSQRKSARLSISLFHSKNASFYFFTLSFNCSLLVSAYSLRTSSVAGLYWCLLQQTSFFCRLAMSFKTTRFHMQTSLNTHCMMKMNIFATSLF